MRPSCSEYLCKCDLEVLYFWAVLVGEDECIMQVDADTGVCISAYR